MIDAPTKRGRGRPKDPRNLQRVEVLIDDATHQRAVLLSELSGQSISAVYRRALLKYLGSARSKKTA